MPDPLVILRQDGTICNMNSSCSNLIGAEQKDLIGADFRNIELFNKLGENITLSLINSTEDFEIIIYNNRHFEVFIFPFTLNGNLKLLRIIFKDISNFVSLEKDLLKRNKELMIISTLSNAFISSENMELAVEDLLEKVLLVTDFSIGWLLLKEGQSYKLKISRGISPEFQKSIEEGHIDSLCKDAIKMGAPFYIAESADISKINLLHHGGIGFLTAIPLFSDKIPIGLLFLASRDKRESNIDFDIASLLSLVGNNVSLILDKIKLFHEIERLSITDGLTGLYNRRYFYKYLDIEIARTKRYGNSFSVMLFDVDNFKKINDTYGHQFGDEVLHELSNILKSASRETDIVVRYGGEEFIIVLPNTSEEEAISLANRIKNIVQENAFKLHDTGGLYITLSGGIASFPQNAHDAKSLIFASDTALYSAKAAGKNTVLCFQGKIDEKNLQET